MAKSKYEIRTATQKVLDELTRIGNSCADEAKRSVRDLANEARREAEWKLAESYHTQKWGNELVRQIGINYSDDGATIYAPRTNTQEMKEQMYYAEYGTGYSSKPWGYYTTPHDKNTHIVKKGGKLVGVTRNSPAVHYMRDARNYLIANAGRRAAENIKLVVTRKQYKRPSSVDEEYNE